MTDQFHPGKCLPDCMMPDSGECCPGYVALYDAYWHLIRGAPAQRTPGDALGPSELIRIELRQAMLDCWNAICVDTDCHPLDIEHQGKKLFFSPNHWADMIAAELSGRLSHHTSLRDLVSSDGLPEAYAVTSTECGGEK